VLEDILPVIHALIDIVAGLKAIDASRQAELHAALETAQGKTQADFALMPPAPATGEENMTSPPDDREPEPTPTA
jgi:hypothetical protein